MHVRESASGTTSTPCDVDTAVGIYNILAEKGGSLWSPFSVPLITFLFGAQHEQFPKLCLLGGMIRIEKLLKTVQCSTTQALPLHRHYLYTGITSTQALPLHRHYLCTGITSIQALPLHRHYLYTGITSTQALPLHRYYLYTGITSTQALTGITSTQALPLYRHYLYTGITSIQATGHYLKTGITSEAYTHKSKDSLATIKY